MLLFYSRVVSYNWDTREDVERDAVDASGIPTIDRYRSLAVSGNTGSLHTGPITFFNIGKGFTRYEGIWQRCPMKIYTGPPFHNSRFITFSLSKRIPCPMAAHSYGHARARSFLFFFFFFRSPNSATADFGRCNLRNTFCHRWFSGLYPSGCTNCPHVNIFDQPNVVARMWLPYPSRGTTREGASLRNARGRCSHKFLRWNICQWCIRVIWANKWYRCFVFIAPHPETRHIRNIEFKTTTNL